LVAKGLYGAERIYLDRVIDYEIDGDQRVDAHRVASAVLNGRSHRG
jgi:hypothetical protein